MKINEAHFIAIDTETSGLDFKTDEVIEIGIARMKSTPPAFLWGSLICPKGDIPPVASAVNHIIKKMCEGMPSIANIEPTVVKYADGNIIAAHNAEFDRSFLPFLQGHTWICTQRLAQHLWLDAPGYGLQVLRYWLDLDAPSGDPHRATADASLCASLLEREIEVYLKRGFQDDVESLTAYAASPIKYTHLPMGKYRNEAIEDIIKKDKNYLLWMLKKYDGLNEDLRQSIIQSLRAGA